MRPLPAMTGRPSAPHQWHPVCAPRCASQHPSRPTPTPLPATHQCLYLLCTLALVVVLRSQAALQVNRQTWPVLCCQLSPIPCCIKAHAAPSDLANRMISCSLAPRSCVAQVRPLAPIPSTNPRPSHGMCLRPGARAHTACRMDSGRTCIAHAASLQPNFGSGCCTSHRMRAVGLYGSPGGCGGSSWSCG